MARPNKPATPSAASKAFSIKRRPKQKQHADWKLPKPSKAAVLRAERAGRRLARRNTDPGKAWVSFRMYDTPRDLLE